MDSASQGPNPGLIMQLALAYRASAIFFAASDLDVFTQLGSGPLTAAEVATRCQAAPEPMRLVLESCADSGLLVRDGDRFANSATADMFLVRGKPAYLGESLKYARDLYPAWGLMTQLLKTGRPTLPPETILGDDKAKTRAFVMAMHERARGIGSVLPHNVDLAGRRRLLDVGGGPGTYSVALCRQTPGLTATVLDRPGVLEVTRELVDAAGFGDRVTLLAGDYLTTDFGSGFDAALLSGMMHRETPQNVNLLLKKAFAALQPGGIVMVSDVFFDDDRMNTPPFATSFALNMMLTSDHGSAHAKTAMERWMANSGFRNITRHDMPKPNPHTLIIGARP
jgi:ubiquinone/menaquinone biosynthesis C-methylase UbiE